GGISVFFTQLPFTYEKKSSPGLTLWSIAVRSTPQAPSSGFAASTASAQVTLKAPANRRRLVRIAGILQGGPATPARHESNSNRSELAHRAQVTRLRVNHP